MLVELCKDLCQFPIFPFPGYLYCEIETAGAISNRNAAPEAQVSTTNVKDQKRALKGG